MIDAAAAWQAAKRYQHAHMRADIIEAAFPGARMLRQVLALAPVTDQGEHFQLAEDLTRKAPVRAHRWLIAVRCWSDEQTEGEPGSAEAARMRAALGPCAEPLCGLDIIDVLACDAKLSRVRSQLTGEAEVLGTFDPCDPAPVRLNASPLAWLRGIAGGVVVLGSADSQRRLLREMAGGVVCDSVEHGEAVQRQMRRGQPALPRVLVAA